MALWQHLGNDQLLQPQQSDAIIWAGIQFSMDRTSKSKTGLWFLLAFHTSAENINPKQNDSKKEFMNTHNAANTHFLHHAFDQLVRSLKIASFLAW